MSSLADMFTRFSRLNVHEEIIDTLDEVKPDIIKAQKEQMLSSRLSTDAPIKPSYSPAYARKKGFSDPDLRMSGTFQDEIFVDVQETVIALGSADDPAKVNRLIDLYTEDIFGLGTDAILKTKEAAEPVFFQRVKNVLEL